MPAGRQLQPSSALRAKASRPGGRMTLAWPCCLDAMTCRLRQAALDASEEGRDRRQLLVQPDKRACFCGHEVQPPCWRAPVPPTDRANAERFIWSASANAVPAAGTLAASRLRTERSAGSAAREWSRHTAAEYATRVRASGHARTSADYLNCADERVEMVAVSSHRGGHWIDPSIATHLTGRFQTLEPAF